MAQRYMQMLRAAVGSCSLLVAEDRELPIRQEGGGSHWVACRGVTSGRGAAILHDDPVAAKPITMNGGGEVSIYVRVCQKRNNGMDLVAYRITVRGLRENVNGVSSFRYDRSEGRPPQDGWDEGLGDNPAHPWAHMHLNFDASETANGLRLPTGVVCPVVLLRALGYWHDSLIERQN